MFEENKNDLNNSESYEAEIQKMNECDGLVSYVEKNIDKIEDISLEELRFKKAEVEVFLDEYDRSFYDENKKIITDEQLQMVKTFYKNVIKQIKLGSKKETKNAWERLNPFIIVYGFVQVIICNPFLPILYQLTYGFFQKLVESFGESIINFPDWLLKVVQIIMILAFPIINIMISYLIYFNLLKSKINKRVFFIIWMLQILLTIITMVLIFI